MSKEKNEIIETKVVYSCKNMYEPFINNTEVLYDLVTLTREKFFKKHFYINDYQYNITRDLFYSNKKANMIKLYNDIKDSDINQKEIMLRNLNKLLDKKF